MVNSDGSSKGKTKLDLLYMAIKSVIEMVADIRDNGVDFGDIRCRV